MNDSHQGRNLLLLLVLAGLLFFLNLGGMGLTDRDEGRNAEAGREMLETGDWISPTFNYEPRYAKPVFVYWLMSLSYHAFGVGEFAARFPSALFAVALILMQYLFLAHLRGPVIGIFAGLMLLVNLEIIGLGRAALTDSVLIFFTTLSLFGFWLGLHGDGRMRHWMWAFYVGMALATLTKGPVGFLVPLLAVIPYLSLTKRWGQWWRTGLPLAGTALCLLLTLPWYVAMLQIHGEDYFRIAQAHTIGRFLKPMEGHSFSVFFYIPVLLLGFFPWSGFLPAALYQTFTGWREARGANLEDSGLSGSSGFSGSTKETKQTRQTQVSVARLPAQRELEWFAAIWLIGGLLFFTLSSTRLPHYIGPLFPAAAILAASYWSRCLLDPKTPGTRASIHLIMGLGFLLAAGFSAAPSLYTHFTDKIVGEFPLAAQIDLGSGPYILSGLLLIGTTLVGYFGLNDAQRPGAFWAAGATLACVALVALVVILPHINRYVIAPPQELAYAAGLNLGPDDRLIVYGTTRPSTVFYARRKVIFIQRGEEEQMRGHAGQPGRTMIVLQSRLRPQLPAETANYVTLLERYGYSLLASESMVKLPANLPAPPVFDPKKDPHARYK